VPTEPKNWRDRWRAFRDAVDAGTEAIFVHPLLGSFLAVVGAVSESYGSDTDSLTVSAEFLPTEPFESVADVGAGVVPVAGPEAIAVIAAEAATALEEAGFTGDDSAELRSLPTETSGLAETWSATDDLDPRRVLLEVSSHVSRIDAFIADVELWDLEFWEAFRSFMLLRDRIASVAESYAAETENTFEYRVESPVPLLSLCARIYGAFEAHKRARQVANANDLRSTIILEAGTVLKMPSVGRAAGMGSSL
jgi:hypothetical protein